MQGLFVIVRRWKDLLENFVRSLIKISMTSTRSVAYRVLRLLGCPPEEKKI